LRFALSSEVVDQVVLVMHCPHCLGLSFWLASLVALYRTRVIQMLQGLNPLSIKAE